MLRRTATRRLGYHPHDASADQALQYSPFGWNYLLPQNMVSPYRVNRTMTAPSRNPSLRPTKFRGVWVDMAWADLDPAMYEALRPWLSKLALSRSLPKTDPAVAVEDFRKVSPLVIDSDADAVRTWVAKVLQLCALRQQGNVGIELWNSLWAADSSSSSSVGRRLVDSCSASKSSSNLAIAVLYCASMADATVVDSDYFNKLFDAVCSDEKTAASFQFWNNSNSDNKNSNPVLSSRHVHHSSRFSVSLWNTMLLRCGQKGNEAGVIRVMRELAAAQFPIETLNSGCVVSALNCIKSDEHYAAVKEMLHWFSPEKIDQIARFYTSLRSRAELDKVDETLLQQDATSSPTACYIINGVMGTALPENDKMFYHVNWHNRIRQPMSFHPRQLFFDYTPTMAGAGTGKANVPTTKKNPGDVVAEKVAQWKMEGLLPEDYDAEKEIKYRDNTAAHKMALRAEKWKKKPKFLDKEKYGSGTATPSVAGKAPGGK